MTTLVVINNWDESFLGNYQTLKGRFIILALSAQVQARLKENKIPFETSNPYFGKKGHESILRHSKLVVDNFRCNFDLEDNLGITKSYERTFFYYFRFHLHYLLFNLEILSRVVLMHEIKEIILYSSDNKDVDATNENLLFNLISAYASNNNLPCHQARGGIKKAVKEKNKHQSLIKFVKGALFSLSLKSYKFLYQGKKTFLLLSDSYDFTSLARDLKQSSPDHHVTYLKYHAKKRFFQLLRGEQWFFLSLLKNPGRKSLAEFKKKIDDCFRALMEPMPNDGFSFYKSVNLTPFLVKFLSEILKPKLVELKQIVGALDDILTINRPKAVFAQHALNEGYALGELCRKKNIRALLISHGTHVSHKDSIARFEWDEVGRILIDTDFPSVAVQTPLCQEFVEFLPNLDSKPLNTGPIILAKKSRLNESRDDLRKRLYGKNSSKKIILQASSPRGGQDSIRPWVYETVDEYLSNINDLIEVTSDLDQVHLAVRFRASTTLSLDTFKTLLKPGKHYDIYSEGSFDQYLLSSDVLISYSSTTIEEALCNKVPVIQYDPDDKYAHVSQLPFAKTKDELNQYLNLLGSSRNPDLEERNLWARYQEFNNQSLGWLEKITHPQP